MIQSAFELRYQVYCVEHGFLQAHDYPDGRESDDRDDDAAHFYSCNRREELVGYVRLVPPDADGCMPWQEYCTELISGARLPAPTRCAEISRLMIRRDYRRCRAGAGSGERRAEANSLMLDLYRQIYQHSVRSGIDHWYAAMEKPLAKLLQRLDFGFLQIGPETDYFGPVAPYLADVREFERRLHASRPALLAWFQMPVASAS